MFSNLTKKQQMLLINSLFYLHKKEKKEREAAEGVRSLAGGTPGGCGPSVAV